jgi:hypothetical protein
MEARKVMPAPWEKYQAKQSGPWERYGSSPAAPQKESRSLEAAVEGFGQAATAGYLPQLQAAAGGLLPKPSVDKELEAQGFTIKGPEDSYISRRDEAIKRSSQLAEESPVAYGAGLLGGAISTAPLAGRALSAFKPVSGLKAAVVGGAAMGALQNPGDTEGELSPVQPLERIKGAVTGAALGGAAYGVTKGVAKATDYIAKLPDRMREFAELKAYKSAGPFKTDIKRTMNQTGDLRRARAIGREMIDKGVVKAGATFDSVADAAEVERSKAGKIIHDVYASAQKEIDSSPALRINDKIAATKLDAGRIADELTVEFQKSLKGKAGGTKALGTLEQVLGELRENGDNVNLADMQEFRRSVDAMINYNKDIFDQPLAKQGLYKLRTKLNDVIQKRLGAMDAVLGGERLQSLKDANRLYSIFADVEDVARNRLATENVNRALSLTDTIAGAGGMSAGAVAGGLMTGDVEGAIKGAVIGSGAGLLNKAGRMYGNPFLTKGADALGKASAKAPGLKTLKAAGDAIGDAPVGLIVPRLKRPEKKDGR